MLSPRQASHYLDKVVEETKQLAVVGIAGPGDPFANAGKTLETLQLVREQYPDMLLCLATNGLTLTPHVAQLGRLNVTHVTITVNAVDPIIGGNIYAWVRPGKQVYRGRKAAALLLERQTEAITMLKQEGITVKINSIIIPSVNQHHIGEVAARMAELGADILNAVPVYPVAGTPFGSLPVLREHEVDGIRSEAAAYLPQMRHCQRCRADAVGLLEEPVSDVHRGMLQQAKLLPLNPIDTRPHVAVASREGVLVNQHLGEAVKLAIYRATDEGFEQVDDRDTPPAGSGSRRWGDLVRILDDCRALLVASAGESPCRVLREAGIEIVMMEGLVEEGLDAVFGGKEIRAPGRMESRCGSGCAGDGMGCM